MKRAFFLILNIFLSGFLLSAQESMTVLKGKVIDASDGYPLIGAAVVVEGTRYGTITDVDGAYELKIPQEKCTVVFSCLGYDEQLLYSEECRFFRQGGDVHEFHPTRRCGRDRCV